MRGFLPASAFILLIGSVSSQAPGPRNDITTIESSIGQGVFISHKKTSVCETTPGVDARAGYVRIPSTLFPFFGTNESNAWNLSTFFWYFPAREDPANAPLAIYLAGGPGESSVFAAATDSGPCSVNKDLNTTTLNPWSYNSHVNMLYIDQPNFAGYSYDEVTEGHFDILTGNIYPGPGEANDTFWAGKWGTMEPTRTAFTTQNTAKVLWQVVQAFTADFPGVQNKSISIWGNSYGGYFAPGALAYFQRQNKALKAGEVDNTVYHHLELNTLGLLNGCVDMTLHLPSYPEMANNNTYGVKLLPQDVYESAKNNFTKDGGCSQAIEQCRQLGYQGDPENLGFNDTVNTFCATTMLDCLTNTEFALMAVTGRSSFDISHPVADPVPPINAMGFFNQEWVQQDLGAAVNFSWAPNAVTNAFFAVGDTIRQNLTNLEYLLDSGLNVAIAHGDRDYVCNWLGGEQVALAAEYQGADTFRSAGYVPMTTNSSYEGGVVKQAGRFSFIRIFQAGHSPASPQPETVYEIFMRAMFHNDIATGKEDLDKNEKYVTEGPTDSWGWTDTLPPDLQDNACSLWWMTQTCTPEQIMAAAIGNATVNEFLFVQNPGGDPVLPYQDDTATNTTSANSTGASGGVAATGTNGATGALSHSSLGAFTMLIGVSLFMGW